MIDFNYEVLDLGLVYYKNAIKESNNLINKINHLTTKFNNNEHIGAPTQVSPWMPWDYKYGDTNKVFCYKTALPEPKNIRKNDFYYEELTFISTELYSGLDAAKEHYSNSIYPFAKNNLKSREHSLHLLRYEEGGYLPPHQDAGISSRALSAVIYLNDQYEGGEIRFPQSGVTLKPEAGSIVFFPSNFIYVHEVAPIKSGVRYSLPHWWHNMKTPINSDGQE
jgi:hypothetical protein